MIDVTVVMGDPRLPDAVKRGGAFNAEDHDTIRRLQGRAVGAAGLQVPLPRQPRHARPRPVGAAHRSRVQPVRRRLQQRPVQGAARPGDARGARPAVYRRRAAGARRLLRQGPRARRGADARRSGAAGDARAARRSGRHAAVRLPGAVEAELRRQLAGHHQGRRRPQREGAARLPRAPARRFPQAPGAGAGVPDGRRILADPRRQSRPGPARAAHPRGRFLQARSQAAEDPRL